jgi:hypothetical protein
MAMSIFYFGLVWYGLVWVGMVWYGLVPKQTKTKNGRHHVDALLTLIVVDTHMSMFKQIIIHVTPVTSQV